MLMFHPTAAVRGMIPGRRQVLLALLLVAAPLAAQPPRTITHPRSESARDQRVVYPLAVLELALARSGLAHRLQPACSTMPQSRALRTLEADTGLDVIWTVTDASREARLRPVRFPIDRGLIGWRVLLVRQGEAGRFAGAAQAADLAAFRFGQGHDWPDLRILRGNGLRVEASPTYEGLFAMLARGRIDALPRSLAEVPAELAARPHLDLALEPALLLHYPSALYFFVRQDDAELADAIASGLETALADGSFEALFQRYHGEAIAAVAPGSRRVVALVHPGLPAGTPLDRPGLWWSP